MLKSHCNMRCCSVLCRAVCCAASWSDVSSALPMASYSWLHMLQVGRQGRSSLRHGRETLAQLSEWMLNRGFLFPRGALPAAKSYSAGQLRLTWLDAGSLSFILHYTYYTVLYLCCIA